MSQPNPDRTDAIRGGQNPPPIDAAVLGGEIGRKQRLQYEKAIARENKFWRNFEYLDGLPGSYAMTFADRHVVNWEIDTEIIEPKEIAYALRANKWDYENAKINFYNKLGAMLCHPDVHRIEALVFGWCYLEDTDAIEILVKNHKSLPGLKAIFLGDIEDREMMISDIWLADVSPILSLYPNLELLHLRGDRALRFSEWRHEQLKALRVESGGLNREAILDLNQLELPELEYLELWMGRPEYGGNSSIDDLMPILSGEKFPKLKYLGLKNCEYANDIAFELVRSPILESLIELDLSMGTLQLEGFQALLNYPKINELEVLNVAANCIDRAFTGTLPVSEFKCRLIMEGQRGGSSYRYCVVGE